ncbi:MAG: hypothetical protein RIR25_729 [Verrucomicrobiota bacterium]|jgi:hypothetical protein
MADVQQPTQIDTGAVGKMIADIHFRGFSDRDAVGKMLTALEMERDKVRRFLRISRDEGTQFAAEIARLHEAVTFLLAGLDDAWERDNQVRVDEIAAEGAAYYERA